MSDIAFAPPRDNRHWLLAASGTLETALVVGVSIVAALLVQQSLSPNLGEALGLTNGAAPDFLAASAAITVQFVAQYGAMAALIILFALVRGRTRLRHYAIAAPREGWRRTINSGVVAGLLVGLIPALVFVLQDVAPIGQNTPLWAVLREARSDWTFWLFMAAGSFVLPPLLEEFAWRGYALGRLSEGFSPGGALVMTTLVFAMLHVQYLRADAAMALTLVGLILASLAFGFLTLRSGSLVPAIIAHVIINFPLPTEGNMAKIALGLGVLIVFRRAIGAELKIWGRTIWSAATLAVLPAIVVIGALIAAAMLIPNGPYWIGGLSLGLLVVLLFLKRSAWE
ncbi:MAG: CPBP family intramembrane glutamic endopeptidase [Terricaulis sp.]